MMNNVIEVSQLTKSFKKDSVLKGLNFSVKTGSVVGILGSNGAGKTTFIQTLIGMLRASSGECKVLGDISPNLSAATKHKVGYVSQEADLIPWMKVSELISYTQSFYKQWDQSLIDTLCNSWKLDVNKVVEKLSLGQKQKLAIILALGHSPELLILDEPVASLDPVTRRQFIKQLVDLNLERNNTVVFSTHITSDLERVAAEVMIIKDGKNYYQGDIDDLKEMFVKLTIRSTKLPNLKSDLKGLVSYHQDGNHAQAVVKDLTSIDIERLRKEFNAEIQVSSMSLEDIFVEIHT